LQGVQAQTKRQTWMCIKLQLRKIEKRGKTGTLQILLACFHNLLLPPQTIDVTNEVQVQEDEISVLDDTLPSPQHHSTPLIFKNKRKIDELENPQPSTSKR
jgi:hypothetical protein